MSESLAALRRKLATIDSLQSVIHTMKAMAASSIGQYERSVQALGDYARTVELGLRVCLRGLPAPATAAGGAERRPGGGAVAAVVFGSDQGLVGQFNDAVAEYAVRALATLTDRPRVWAVGERVHARLQEAGLRPADLFVVPGSVRAITPLVGRILLASRAHGEPDGVAQLHLFHNRPTTGALYEPTGRRLLPLDESWRQDLAGLAWPTRNLPEVVGAPTGTLRALVREHLFVSLFRACAESLASEHACRLEAMQRAEQNIGQMRDELQGTFYRTRQSAIDEELFDLVSGFEAMSGRRRPGGAAA